MKKTWKNVLRLFKSCFICLIVIIVLPDFASSEVTYQFERLWPTLKQPWYFYAHDIDIDAEGNIYIADTGRNRIQKFSPDGAFISKWGSKGSGEGEFDHPKGIAIDATGNIYVADTHNNRIQKFTSEGTFDKEWGSQGSENGEFSAPGGIAVDEAGNVYVADRDNHRVQKFTSEGTHSKSWGVKGEDDGMFNFPEGIAIDAAGNIYVADKVNHRIQKFTSEGEFITKWGKIEDEIPQPGSGEGEFNHPQGIAIDAAGNMYVADTYNNRIQKFTSGGTFDREWGSQGAGNGEFYDPSGITVDSVGNIYVADIHNYRIQKFTSEGTFILAWAGWGTGNGEFYDPSGITVDSEDNIYVADTYNHRIQKFTSEGTFDREWGSQGIGNGEFNYPCGITVDSEDNIYVADTCNNRIQKFTSDGSFDREWGKHGSEEGDFYGPEGIAIDAAGNIYVADTCNHRIQKFTSDGSFDKKWGSQGSGEGEFIAPKGIAIDAAGNIYVADKGNHRIQKFTSEGTFDREWGSQGSDEGMFESPKGIAVDAEGDVYVADLENNRIQEFRSDGTFLSTWGSFGNDPGQFSVPHDLAFGPEDRIYIADTKNNRIQVFKKYEALSNPKAIIVAGGGPFPGNSLWGATQVSANFAYRALIYQGFTEKTIYYLSSDTDLDYGSLIVDKDATNDNLKHAITEWVMNEEPAADSLVLYLTDHGGAGTFRMSGNETLSSDDESSDDDLAGWLNMLQEHISGRVIIIYDACQSGSFIDDLSGNNRIIITSTMPDERAKFLSQGNISFSSFFWTHIFNGLSIKEAFLKAEDVINFAFDHQNPMLSGAADNVYIGNAVPQMIGESPNIESVSSPRDIDGDKADLYADVDPDPDGIARVWAVIWDSDSSGSSDDPVLSLPTLELAPAVGNRYEGTYEGFDKDGTYPIAIYAMDGNNNTSIPKLTSISRNYHLTRKAIIVAGGEGSGLTRSMIETNAGLAYDALKSQLYTDDDIYFMSVTTFREEVDDGSYLFNLGTYIKSLASDSTIENLDLVIYLIGSGDTETFMIKDAGETLTAFGLAWGLAVLQNSIPWSRVSLIYDADRSGSFIPLLTPPEGIERILITSSRDNGAAYFSEEGDIAFSSFFWSQVANGATVYNAFAYAEKAISYFSRKNVISFSCYKQQSPLLEADGNSVANEESDYQVARSFTIGIGMKYADDRPHIGSVSVEETEDGVKISAEDITLTKPIQRVWAVIKPIGYCPGHSGEETADLTEIKLELDEDEKYVGEYTDPLDAYKILVYAIDVGSNTSLPKETKIYQTEGGDIYEVDDEHSQANVIVVNHPTPQPHNFHSPNDVDWVKFYGLASEGEDYSYRIKARNLGTNCKPVIELYYEDESEPIEIEDTIVDNSVSLEVELPQDGMYYVMLYDKGHASTETEYNLQVDNKDAGGLLVLITGKVMDRFSWEAIDGAFITTDGGGAAISCQGEYDLYQKPGDWSISAYADGYSYPGDLLPVNEGDQIITKDIKMDPLEPSTTTTIRRITTTTTTTTTIPECVTDEECDDGLFCNGAETCVGGKCRTGSNPCPEGTECIEEAKECVPKPAEINITLRPTSGFWSHLIPLPLFMSIVGEESHFNKTTEVSFDGDALVPPIRLVPSKRLILVFSLIKPAGVGATGSTEVLVTVTSTVAGEEGPYDEIGSANLTLNMLPLIFDEEEERLTGGP